MTRHGSVAGFSLIRASLKCRELPDTVNVQPATAPACMTSLFLELVSVPIPPAASSTITSWPASASARPTARPTTPAPTTTASTMDTDEERLRLGASWQALLAPCQAFLRKGLARRHMLLFANTLVGILVTS